MSREKILIRTSWVSTIGNAILSASKIIVGLFAGSLAVLGDGIDSATDVIISIVMIFTARIMNRWGIGALELLALLYRIS